MRRFTSQRGPDSTERWRAPIFTACAIACLWAISFPLNLAGAETVQPNRLPAPEIPLRSVVPPATMEGGAPAAKPGTTRTIVPAPYLGPPSGIDGPPIVGLPGEEIPPGAIQPDGLAPDGEIPDGMLDEDLLLGAPQKLEPYKNGFFQKLSLSAAWFGNSSDPADLGATEIETFLTVAVPAPIVEWPLLITPGLNATFIDGPTVTDLPSRLYLTYVDFMWLPRIVNNWTALISVAPTVYGDFDAHQFRLTGKGLVIYDCVPNRLQVVGGVLYLNRENIRLLPAGGVIWMPMDWTRLELIFPKPKIGLRYSVGPGFEDWIYGTAEFGGNTWPIIRASGARDDVTYVDYRLLLGVERKLNGGAGYRLEAGYVFGRSIRFTSGNGDFDPQDTILLRGGITY